MSDRYLDPHFMEWYSKAIIDLMILLGIPGVGDNHIAHEAFRRTPVGEMIDRAYGARYYGELEYSDYELARAWCLANELHAIERHDRALLDSFGAELRRRTSLDQFFGIRCEISVAARLIEAGLSFTHPDPPDFTIQIGAESCHIESTSAHISHPSQQTRDYSYKIESAIRAKAKKSYCAPDVALCIDMTNILLNVADMGDFTLTIRDSVRSELGKTKFGSVILIAYIVNLDTGRYGPAHIRIDHPDISATLRTCLDWFYPDRSEWVNGVVLMAGHA